MQLHLANSILDLYRWGFLGVAVVALVILIVFLLLQNKWEKLAKKSADELRQSARALLESEQRFRVMADGAPMLIWLSDADDLRTDFNRAWLEFTGRPLEQERGKGWAESVHPDDLAQCLEVARDALRGERGFTHEYRLRRHDGQYRWMLRRALPRFLSNGDFAGFIGCCIDVNDLKEAETVRAEFSGRLIRAQEEERARIARELHDDINQRMALLANGIRQLDEGGSGKDAAARSGQLADLGRLTDEISADIQHLSHQLHSSKLQYLGVAAAVRDLCQEFSRQHHVEVACSAQKLPRNVDQNVSLCLFRIVQESLRNVAKHSHAAHVKVELVPEGSGIRLRVSDDGVGFDSADSSHYPGLGLVSMRERVRGVGGEFSLWSRSAFGTKVECIVPIAVKRAHNNETAVI